MLRHTVSAVNAITMSANKLTINTIPCCLEAGEWALERGLCVRLPDGKWVRWRLWNARAGCCEKVCGWLSIEYLGMGYLDSD